MCLCVGIVITNFEESLCFFFQKFVVVIVISTTIHCVWVEFPTVQNSDNRGNGKEKDPDLENWGWEKPAGKLKFLWLLIKICWDFCSSSKVTWLKFNHISIIYIYILVITRFEASFFILLSYVPAIKFVAKCTTPKGLSKIFHLTQHLCLLLWLRIFMYNLILAEEISYKRIQIVKFWN